MKKTCLFILCALILMVCAGAEGEEKTRVLVALGDSYTSGEGIEPYYGQDAPMEEKCKNPDWLAHRSENNWPGMLTLPGVDGPLAAHRGENFFFAAASGARTRNLFLLTEEEQEAGDTAGHTKSYYRDGISGTAVLAPQLEIFDELDEKGLKADYVVLTIGGNDVDFVEIVKMAVLGLTGSLAGDTGVDKGVSLLDQKYEAGHVRESLKRTFHDIASRAGEQAVILVAGYPYPLVEETAGSIFTAENAGILNGANFFFCMDLINLVDECRNEGMKICYVGVNNVFEGHGAYAEDPYIYPVILMAGAQDLDARGMINYASMHLNLKGAEAYARCVQDAINQLEAGSSRYIFDTFADEN